MSNTTTQGVRLNIKKVVEHAINIDKNSRKKIKAQVEDILFSAHVIARNSGVKQVNIISKLAREIKEDRMQREIHCVEFNKSKVKQVLKQKISEKIEIGENVFIDSIEPFIKANGEECKTFHVINYHYFEELEGDIKEALTLFNLFKHSGQIEVDEQYKLKKVILNGEIENPKVKHVKDSEQENFEIRRGVQQQKLPNAVKSLSRVKYSIDKAIRDTAEEFDFQDYANWNCLTNTYGFEDQEFNVNYFACSRLRIYPNHTSGYSPQGSDLGKALIKNKLLEADKDLTPMFIKQAEEFMDGKCPFTITKENLLLIDWKTAPKYKFRMLQLQNDFKEYLWTGWTSANVDLDARCSGSQILSGLGRYSDITAHLGMEPTEHELDLYEKHAKVFTEIVKEKAPDIYHNNQHLIENLMFIRKVAKRPTMTYVYNATLTSIMAEFRKKDTKFIDSDVVEAAKLMQEALGVAAGGTKNIMDWLKTCARIIANNNNKVIQWTRPDGLIASQEYIKTCEFKVTKMVNFTDQEIKAAILKGRKKPKTGWRHSLLVTFQVPHLGLNGQKKPDPSAHVNGITANFVHSLDSYLAMRIIDILSDKGIEVTRFVHDSISVHMNYRDELYDAIIQAHLELFSGDYLSEVKQEWEMLYGVDLPELPEYGDWKPETLLECERFWE